MIPLFMPEFTQEMRDAAVHALQNEFYVMGESVHRFEEDFAKYCGTRHAVSVSSGTAALKIALIAMGLKAGERVVTTPNSFIATSNSVIHAGGKPVFADIEANTGSIDPSLINMKGARGVIPVHIYGSPAKLDEIKEAAGGGFILEDACQAHGAEYKGRKVGSIGDAGCFSFYSAKNMTVCGDGGMIITNNEGIAAKAAMLRDCGRKSKYEHPMIGFTERLNTVNAAIGRVQLTMLDGWNEKRRGIAGMYRSMLPANMLLSEGKDALPVYHLFVVKSGQRDALQEFLKSGGITTGIHYPIPIHMQPSYMERFGYGGGEFPVAERFAREVLSLPIYPGLKKDDVRLVCEKVNEFGQGGDA